jgi:transposase
MSKKKKYSPVFKTKVALSAIREEGTLSELSAKYGVNPNMISKWKKQALDNMSGVFSSKCERSAITNEHQIKQLHAKIGELTVEKDFLQDVYEKLGRNGGLR